MDDDDISYSDNTSLKGPEENNIMNLEAVNNEFSYLEDDPKEIVNHVEKENQELEDALKSQKSNHDLKEDVSHDSFHQLGADPKNTELKK